MHPRKKRARASVPPAVLALLLASALIGSGFTVMSLLLANVLIGSGFR